MSCVPTVQNRRTKSLVTSHILLLLSTTLSSVFAAKPNECTGHHGGVSTIAVFVPDDARGSPICAL